MTQANFQLVMRMCLGARMNERVDSDKKLSKHNYGARNGYSMETVC